jgi:DNA-binding MarR family transcriptional regulator
MSSVRIKEYVPLAQEFAGRVILFHSAVAETLGLHATDLRALRLLAWRPMTAGALGEGLRLTGAATTALIDRLERAGYVVRERDTLDRRKVTIYATPEKLREVDEAYGGIQAKMSKLLSAYSEEEFSVIADYLKRTAQALADATAEIPTDTS